MLGIILSLVTTFLLIVWGRRKCAKHYELGFKEGSLRTTRYFADSIKLIEQKLEEERQLRQKAEDIMLEVEKTLRDRIEEPLDSDRSIPDYLN